MVYEQLEMTTKHYTLDTTSTTDTPDQPSTITLVCKKLPVQILATSKLINTEAMQILRPRMLQLKAQPMRFLFKAELTSPLRVFSRSLSRCFGYDFRPQDLPALSEAAQAFSNCCVKTRRLADGRPRVEIMVTDKGAPSFVPVMNMLCNINWISTRSHLEITVLRKEPATGVQNTIWQGLQSLELWLMSMNKRAHLHLADEPDAERWRRDWEETADAFDA